MNEIISNSFNYALAYIPLFMLGAALIIGITIAVLRGKHSGKLKNTETFLGLMLILTVGVPGLFSFFSHTFFSTHSTGLLSWRNNPLEFKSAIANLSIGLAGIFSFSASKGFRWATIFMTTCFLWGSAAEHLILSSQTAGIMFYTNLLIPIILMVLMSLYTKRSRTVFNY